MVIEGFKRIKEGAKKLIGKTGTFINKAAKAVEKLQPVVNVVKEFIPYGEVIDKGIELGTEVAKRTGNVMKKIGDGRNVLKAIGEEWDDIDEEPLREPINTIVNNIPEKAKQNVQKIIDTGKKVVQTINNNVPSKQNDAVPKIDRPTQFITNKPPKVEVQQPSFMSNVLNN